MPRRARVAILLSSVLSCSHALAETGSIPHARSYCRKIFSMPAFFQRDKRFGELPGGGEFYCAPVAVSNALAWLDANLCPGLLPAGGDAGRAQFEMIRLLGSAAYTKTDPKRGSHPLDIMKGLAKYCEERGYRAEIEWVGWPDGGANTVGVTPEAEWMLSGVEGQSNVVLLVSCYRHEETADVYSRRSGHYMTMTGYIHAGEDQVVIFAHDPEKKGGRGSAYRAFTLKRLKGGVLLTGRRNVPELSAAGFWSVGEKERPGGKLVGIIDGAMRFRLVEAKARPPPPFAKATEGWRPP